MNNKDTTSIDQYNKNDTNVPKYAVKRKQSSNSEFCPKHGLKDNCLCGSYYFEMREKSVEEHIKAGRCPICFSSSDTKTLLYDYCEKCILKQESK